MSDAYAQLLAATIQHLEVLKSRGVRHVPVRPETLAALAGTPVKPAARPAPLSFAAPPAPAPAPRPVAAPRPVPPPTPAPPPAPAPVAPAPVVPPPPSVVVRAPVAIPAAGDRAAAFAELRQRALACVQCPNLVASRRQVVFGVGNEAAELMFVGEAPGVEEDAQGEPFVGPAGQMLTKMIGAMGLSRAQVYIGNVLKCRPDTPGQKFGNRPPTPEEMATCVPFLQAQIDLIRPRVLVALGASAMAGLLGHPVKITGVRGRWLDYRGIPLMPTFHPSYVLRQQEAAGGLAVKRQVWEDLLAAMAKLGLPISDKQRNYFLKA